MTPDKTSKKRFKPTRGTLVALLAVSMLNCMGGAAVAPALPLISQAFPESHETIIALIISLPSLSVALSSSVIGVIADRFGKAKTLVVSLIVFTVGGLSGLFLPSVESILVGRFIMGFGMGGVATASTALIADYYDAEMQSRVLGMQSAATGASIMVLETSGGFLALLGWRIPFIVYAVGIVLLILVLLFVREPYHETVSASTNNKPATVVDEPTSKPNARNAAKGTLAIVVICLTFTLATTMVNFLIPAKMPYMVAAFGGSTALAGLNLGAFGLANIISSLCYARAVRRMGRFPLAALSFLIIAAANLCLMGADSEVPILIGSAMVNAGVGLIMPLVSNWLADLTTHETSGKYMSLYVTFMQLGSFLGPFWIGAVTEGEGSYGPAFVIAAVGMILLAAFCVFGRFRLSHLQYCK